MLCLSVPMPLCPETNPAGKFEYLFPSTEQEPVETPFASKSTMTSTILVVVVISITETVSSRSSSRHSDKTDRTVGDEPSPSCGANSERAGQSSYHTKTW